MEDLFSKWDLIKDRLRTEYNFYDVSYRTWIKPLELYQVDQDNVKILVTLEGSLDYIRNKYTLPFEVVIEEISGKHYNVKFITPEMAANPSIMSETTVKSKPIPVGLSNLNSKYTFDTFVVGKNNAFAHAASLAVAENPGQVYNPLFLYGGVGLGKTHLMHSIAHFISENYPEKRVLYVTSEAFTNNLIEALRTGNSGNINAMPEFRDKYRNIDVLLVDDIQFIIGRDSTQEEFFHTFNDLYESHKAIIISADKPPKDFASLEERYRTRFEWGIIADISSPDFETRMAILRKKEEIDHLQRYNIPAEVLEYIATNVKSNIRELEGALNKLIAMANLQNKPINLDLAQDALKDIITPEVRGKVTPKLILDIVADHYNVSVDDIIGQKRNAEIVMPRQVFMYLCRKLTNAKYQEIGEILDNRNHSTIKHGEKTIINMLKEDETIANTVDILIKKIQPN